MPFAILCWFALALLFGLWRGARHEETFLIDFSHGFRLILGLPFILLAMFIYLLATLMFGLYDIVGTVAEWIVGDTR